jgi:hypothetical protein
MKSYPSINGPSKAPKQSCIAFYKYDGSNLRFEYSRKHKTVTKYGTRRRLFDHTDEVFGSAVQIWHDQIEPQLLDVIKKHYREVEKITFFCEFLGPNSFAGQHEPTDPKELVLIDVELHKKGFISPRDFVNIFGGFDFSSQVVYEGNMNDQLVTDVRSGSVEGIELDEGIVCKGGSGHSLWRCKIKTDAYKEKLKEMYGSRWHEFWEGDSDE